ncbi:MAG: transcription antitermination factor NusB [Spirochaetae bacterium HGW-Spirochaetae-1]|jgi:N utilization substance protein B|nr:MAG: transcription antitermination factor NusB [Spirochaetae bacterium HGW-Spirochaetae-1]
MGHRRKAREYALQGLYMHELRMREGTVSSEALRKDVTSLEWVDVEISPDIREFAVTLIMGALTNRDTIDTLIDRHSRNWKLERLSIVDKSILRLSIFEMVYLPEIPVAVTINEGIELGKIYGGEGSGQFINGILDAVNKSEIETKE